MRHMTLGSCLLMLTMEMGTTLFGAEIPRIQIGLVTLRLGEPRAQVLEAFGERYEIREGESGGGMVWDVQNSQVIGTVGFRNGRLALGLRDWINDDQAASYPYARAVFSAFKQLVSEGRTTCTIDVGDTHSPETDIQTAFLNCSGKRLEFTNTEFRIPQHNVQRVGTLTEIIGDYLRTK